MNLSELSGTPPPALQAQRARVAAIRSSGAVAPKPAPVATSAPLSDTPPSQRLTERPVIPAQACALQFEPPLEFVRIEFLVSELSVDDTSITLLFRHDFKLHLGELKPRLRLHAGGQVHDVAYLGGMFQIPSMGLRGMTFVRILPEQ